MKKSLFNRKTKERADLLAAIAIIAAFYAFMHLVGIGCPIRFVTGVSCPGCGMTRAYLALFRGDISGAFGFHPLFCLPPVMLGLYFFKKRIPERIYKNLLLTIAAAFVIIYMIRLFSPYNDVVVFHPEEGMLYNLIYKIFHGG